MKWPLASTQPLFVTVANGSKVLSKFACLGFCWEMQGEDYQADLRLLKLGGCHIILGVDWMREGSPISFDFNKLEVTLEKDGRRVEGGVAGEHGSRSVQVDQGEDIAIAIQKEGVPSSTTVLN